MDIGKLGTLKASKARSSCALTRFFGPLILANEYIQCRLVHHAEDKCAFVHANCPEAGLLSYLSLYYCQLPKAKPFALTILTVWVGLLFTTIGIAASDFFCINLSTIASILGMSESMAGVTFLAFGNGSPDVFSTFAAMNSHSGSLAVGELIGAAGFITAVVAGSMALVREFRVGKKTFVRDVGFFVVAASFSMVFMADGTLYLWECCAMIGFYIFYVIIVVVWHWYLGRRRRRREREAAARGQYLAIGEEIEVTEEDGDDDRPIVNRPYRDVEDFGALERSSTPGTSRLEPPHLLDADGDGANERHLAAEMASNMRVTRPRGSRKNTITPIRPSLVGALEFRSILASLQKDKGSSSRLTDLRRYSDDPHQDNTAKADLGVPASYNSTPLLLDDPSSDYMEAGNTAGRTRAVSMNDAEDQKPPDPATFSVARIPDIGLVAATPTFPRALELPGPGPAASTSSLPISPFISLTPPASSDVSRSVSPAPSHERRRYQDNLVPPSESFPGARYLRGGIFNNDGSSDSTDRPHERPVQLPRLKIPPAPMKKVHSRTNSGQSPIVQFPAFTDSPLPISSISPHAPNPNPSIPPLPLADPMLIPSSENVNSILHSQERPVRWWPYHILPDPHTMVATLFPTLCTWREKSPWDKFVSVICAPSIFLLAITLPVVEADTQDDEVDMEPVVTRTTGQSGSSSSAPPALVPDSPSLEPRVSPEWIRYRRSTGQSSPRSSESRGWNGHNSAAVAVAIEQHLHHPHSMPLPVKTNSLDHISESPCPTVASPRDWNRWLVAVQIFTAPLFVIFIIWANYIEQHPGFPIYWFLGSLLGSTVVTALLVTMTTPTEPPKYRFLLCFLGFIVSISWISTIANEVVGVLKAFGVILGISDAILGLTIFAVGNSLGDLVADITVARLGYPVMALSACFGGPMLNILLGIGISGLYMTVKEANSKHKHHPDKDIRYRPYQIEVSGTLMVSGITLLVTLVGLLIVVPLNKWVMSRRIGWGLIMLWSISTVVNLAVEVSGVWDETAVAV